MNLLKTLERLSNAILLQKSIWRFLRTILEETERIELTPPLNNAPTVKTFF